MHPYKTPIAISQLIVLCMLIVCISNGCSKDEPQNPDKIDNVLLVYLGGDRHAISTDSKQKLDAIISGYRGGKSHRVLVYHDYSKEQPYLIELAHNKQNTLEIYEEENSADPAVIKRFIAKAKERYPDAQFNLLVFSHATGWLPKDTYANPSSRSIITDGDNEMEFLDFAKALPNNMFNYIIFEACHMAGIEVLFELKDKANYIIASSAEIIAPGFLNSYSTHINELVNGNPIRFIQSAFDCINQQEEFYNSSTLSVIDTKKLSLLADYVRENCDFTKSVEMNQLQYFDRGHKYLFCDFTDYHLRLLKNANNADLFETKINDCIMWEDATSNFLLDYEGFEINKHSGMTVYIMQDSYPKLNNSYSELSWYQSTRK